MPDPQNNFAEAILAVLRAAQEAGVGKLGRTALTKFLYLLDLYAAEDRAGATLTGAAWKFWYFGPYAAELDAEIDTLASRGAIQSEARENGDKEYTLFYLGEWSTAKTLETLGVSHEARTRLTDTMKQYSFDLPGLLNHVYFETSPMAGAKPGEPLDFSKAERMVWTRDVKPHRFGMPDKAKAKRARELVAKLGEIRRARAYKLATPPIYDDHYAHAVAAAEEDFDLPEGPHHARLDFE